MARIGTCFFDSKGITHKTADDATRSDLAAILGKVGEGDSLAPGIATIIMEKRSEIERVLREHDDLTAENATPA